LIIFRCSASPTLGLGHLNRCLALADSLNSLGESCVMFGPSKFFCPSDKSFIFSDWIEEKEWESSDKDSKNLIRIANKHSSHMVILDDYRVDKIYQKNLLSNKVHFLLFDNNLRSNIYADIVLNSNPIITENNYKFKLFNSKVKLLLGLKYSIIRPEFPPTLKEHKSISTTKRVLITFGGGDDRGAIIVVLKALLRRCMQRIEFIVVSGVDNPNNHTISQWIDASEFSNVQLRISPRSIAKIFASCDIAVMSGGTTVYEIASIGLPMILIAIADNQVQHSKDWHQISDSVEFLGSLEDVKVTDIIGALDKYLLQQGSIYNHSALVDGEGKNRVALEVIKIREKYEHLVSN
jgi:UDP-2,4-diacetamido-2,4,6-trideoxy-beta-L-altropyranose hydrolase